MRKHSMPAILNRFDKETKRLQRIACAKQNEQLHAIQAEREARPDKTIALAETTEPNTN